MSTARQDLGVGVINGFLYAVGGDGADGNALSSMEVYDPSFNEWRAGASMSTARWGPGVGVINGSLYAVAGQGSDGQFLSSMDVLFGSWSHRQGGEVAARSR